MKEAAKVVQEGGKIITIVTSLLAAFTGLYTSYAGSKAPVEHFTRGVAKELSGRRISVNAIGPGPMDTRMSRLCSIQLCCLSSLTTRLSRSILLPSRV
jgi:NAD(P)-dependent dehydrogenase (short-subunit alcohol dehydrogenase family)